MQVYIAGPITGIKDYEKNFKQAEMALRASGHVPVNPVKIGQELQKRFADSAITHEEYMNEELPYLLRSDAILMLDGWENSEGAKLEHDVAAACGKTFIKVKLLSPRWGEN